ncbi:MAG: DUF4394 domain-containing protein [Polyangiaceae bacterium]|jgi:Domain of unknown function (DUF4394)|nr:DUF4394 domain-containing protein [Polyangiaceae bacterium]
MNRRSSCLFALFTAVAIAAVGCSEDGPIEGGTKGGPEKASGAGGAGGGETAVAALPPATPAAFDVVALGENNQLFFFKSDDPGSVKQGEITGADDAFEGIDVRSSDGRLYGLTAGGKLYQIDLDVSGNAIVAEAVDGAQVGDLAVGEGGVAFDFNPKSKVEPDQGNALRVITTGDNYRLNPVTAKIAGTDTALAYKAGDDNEGAEPQVVAAGYLNAYAGTATTVLYDVDAGVDALVKQGDPDPNLGVLTTVGPLGIDVGDVAGFDIVTTSNPQSKALVNAAFLVNDDTFYEVDLATGEATEIGPIDGASALRGLAVLPPRAASSR